LTAAQAARKPTGSSDLIIPETAGQFKPNAQTTAFLRKEKDAQSASFVESQ